MKMADQNLSTIDNDVATMTFRTTPLTGLRVGLRLGVIFGRHSVNLSLIQNIFGKNFIRDIASFPLDLIESSQSQEIFSKVVELIRNYLYQNQLPAIPVNIGLYGENMAFRRMYIPVMSSGEISNAVLWEGEKLFPFKFSDCRLHYHIADKVRGESKKISSLGVNITAVKSEIIEDLYQRFYNAGLKPGQINFLPNLTSDFVKISDKNAGRYQLHIHLDNNLSFAVFLHNNELSFFQEFMSLPFFDSSVRTGITNIESIISELQSFIDIYIAHTRDAAIDTILISGKTSQNSELLDYINSTTGIPCQYLLDPAPKMPRISGISIRDLYKNLPVIATAAANPNFRPLAPDAIRQKAVKRQFYSRVGLIAMAFIIIACGLFGMIQSQEQKVESELESIRAKITEIENSPAYHTYLNIVGKLNRGKEFLRMSSDKQHSHLGVLIKSLSFDIPESLNLTEIHTIQKENGYSMRLTGHVRIKNFSPEIVLAGYIKALEEYPYFNNVEVISHNKNLEDEEFDLDFQIMMDIQV
ncbi:MAG: hypothetical protein V3V99_09600 [candidate division Zixibacteria bacterium]